MAALAFPPNLAVERGRGRGAAAAQVLDPALSDVIHVSTPAVIQRVCKPSRRACNSVTMAILMVALVFI